jgi:hypothetical protein
VADKEGLSYSLDTLEQTRRFQKLKKLVVDTVKKSGTFFGKTCRLPVDDEQRSTATLEMQNKLHDEQGGHMAETTKERSLREDEPEIIYIHDDEELLPLHRTVVNGVVVYTTTDEKTQELKERFRKMMLPREPKSS